jgi:DNA modification methylase
MAKNKGLIHKGKTTPWGGYVENMKESGAETTTAWQGEGTSIFDPVLCEICYTWFNIKNGSVLDPFAGGSVRGIVAAMLGCDYTGIELRQEQVDANLAQAHIVERAGQEPPKWICHDSAKMDEVLPVGAMFDMVFTCPPYGDLEVYSDDPADISNMSNNDFLSAYRAIIAATYRHLQENRFAVFVVGDYRLKDGSMANFVSNTIQFAIDAGYKLYNEMILLTAIGSLPVRAGRQFQSSRKAGKTHQNILVFYKGDPKKVKSVFGEVVVQGVDIDDIANQPKTVAKQS